MFLIRGDVKDYAWGIVNGLSPWLGGASDTHVEQHAGRPQAELWFGVHSSGPSPVVATIGGQPPATLADHLTRDQAPVLAKILAAAQPLSVQVHPNAHQAEEMWTKQQVAGPQILADSFEKAEVLVALEPFDAFVGWRPSADAAEIIERVEGLGLAASALHADDRVTAIQMICEHRGDASRLVAQLPAAIEQANSSGAMSRVMTDAEVAAYSQAVADFPEDIGVLLTPLLDFTTLAPGEAVYLAPGIPHSYVHGVGFEVMTSSDNVLRLGLTGKPVYVDHALKILDFSTAAQFLSGSDTIEPTGAAFGLQVVRAGSARLESGNYRLVVAVEGSVDVGMAGENLTAVQGTAVAVTAGEGPIDVAARGLAIAVIAPAAP